MLVLKPISSEEVSFSTKIPDQLQRRLNEVKKQCKERGYLLDVKAEVIKALDKLAAKAEQDLKSVTDKKPAVKPA